MNTQTDARPDAVAGPVERPVRPLVEILREAAEVWGEDDGGKLYTSVAERLEKLEAENAALKRDLEYARDGLTKGRTRMREDNERLRGALRAVLAWGTDENYERARAACSRARDMLRTTDAKTDRPSTPVGWSDTDWLAHLERLQQNEAAYAKGPLPERGWD